MKAAIVIPARYASTRLPGKPLLAKTGKPLIQHVYEQARQSKHANEVIVATDDERIFNAVTDFGGAAAMTSAAHESGGARVAEAAIGIDTDIIVNLQGDEPEVDPADLDRLIEIHAKAGAFASTLACRFPKSAVAGPGSPDDPAAVKAILGERLGNGVYHARYFTRTICPYPLTGNGEISEPERYFLHLGVYAFTKECLRAFAEAPAGAIEKAERLEQMRILEMGEKIAIGLVARAAPGVDTPEDYAAFVRRFKSGR